MLSLEKRIDLELQCRMLRKKRSELETASKKFLDANVPLDKRRRELVEEEQKMVCKFSNQLEWRVPQSDTKLILMHSDKFMCVAQKIIVHHNPFALDWVCGYIKWAAHQSLQLVPCYVLRVHVSFLWGIDSVISHVASSWMFCSGWNSL